MNNYQDGCLISVRGLILKSTTSDYVLFFRQQTLFLDQRADGVAFWFFLSSEPHDVQIKA